MSSAEFARVGLPAAIGPYRVLREIGRGGMGLVYEAVHEQLGKRVAIKTLRAHLLEDDSNVQRFLREGRAACHIRHPHVVEIYELGSHEGAPYLVMDLLEGVHLGSRLEREGTIAVQALVDLMLPILAAVSAAHAAGVVHRDLKPSNIMLARGRGGGTVPKVLDFGTSKLRGEGIEDSPLTITGAVLGTLHYMSPEQTRAPKDADARSDQYSLGLILYECATGAKPFSAESVYDVMQAIMTAPIEAPSRRNPALPKAFDEVVLRAMRRRPGDRYASVAELGVALLAFASSEARAAWERELTSAARAAPNESSARPIVIESSARGSDPEGTTLPESFALRARERKARAARRSKLRKLGVAASLLALAIVVGLAWRARSHHVPPLREATKPPVLAATPAPRSAPSPAIETAPFAATPVGSVAIETRDEAAPSPAKIASRSEPAPAPAAKKPAPAKRRSAKAPVRLGDNGAPILE